MATVHQNGTVPQPSPAPADTSALILIVNGASYTVEILKPEDPDVCQAIRLQKVSDGECHDAARTRAGLVVCTCGDYQWRRDGITSTPCKHGAALVRAGLLDAPTPAPRPVSDRDKAAAKTWGLRLPAVVAPCCGPSEFPCDRCAAKAAPSNPRATWPAWTSEPLGWTTTPPEPDPEPVDAPAEVEPTGPSLADEMWWFGYQRALEDAAAAELAARDRHFSRRHEGGGL